MVGQIIAHYRILEKLGEGGMGVVYAAEDTNLGRRVALKFVSTKFSEDPDDRERLVREARAASVLDHPNTCAVHEIATAPDGRLFIVMPYYEGVPLSKRIERGPLPIDEAVEIAAQIADGLQAAHDKGIVHRDVKSANVMVTDHGRAVLLDFGLSSAPGTSRLTKTGTTLGTVPYMAPEQARGERADRPADLWSLGVVLYEMLTGRLPFRSEYELAVVYSILNDDPDLPGHLRADVSPDLDRIVGKALSKEISGRYASAGEMAKALRAVGQDQQPAVALPHVAARSRAFPARRRMALAVGGGLLLVASLIAYRVARPDAEVIDAIAVLPLDNLTGDPSQEFFVDGMHEAVLSELSGITALKVISRTSAMRYKGSNRPPMPQIARELGVRGIVEGTVAREGNQVRIAVRLIEGPEDRQLWQGTFEREVGGVLALQAEVARAITDRIRVALTPRERDRLADRKPVVPAAYEAYLLGKHYWNRRTILGLRQAVEQFRTSVSSDPSYVPAYVGLADAYMLLGEQGAMAQDEARELGAAALETALRLDRDLAEAQSTLGQWKLHFDLDFDGAVRAFDRALELNPGNADTHSRYGRALGDLDRFDDAVLHCRRAVELDPLSPVAGAYLGQVLIYAGRYDEAQSELLRAADINPDHPLILHNQGELELARGRPDQAVRPLERSTDLSGQGSEFASSHYLAVLGTAYARTGRRADAIVVRDELAERDQTGLVSEFDMAIITMAVGDRNGALGWLEHGLASRDVWLAEINAWPWFDSLRGEPRFEAVLRALGLDG